MSAASINRALPAAGFALAAGLAGIAAVVPLGSPSLVVLVAALAFVTVCVWMFCSERYALTLAVVTLYLGLIDGYLKLSTGSEGVTLARDALLYAICFGIVARGLIRRQELRLPPYAGLVLAYVLVVVVQLVNPGTGGLGRGLAALRPHLEFIPLFFLAYMTVRTKNQLRGLLVLLIVIGAANGIVSYMQFVLTPEQLAAWGPGYAERIDGSGPVSERVFYDSSGEARVRPFGLAGDSGQGGFVGLLALPAAIALLSFARGRWRWLTLVLGFALALAIVTSQGRAVMLGAFVAVIGYTILTLRARRLVPTLAGITVVAAALVAATSFSSGQAGPRAFDRVQQIAPSRLLDSASEQRGKSVVLAPEYAAKYPVGAGLGTVGPAATVGRDHKVDLDGETEFNFLILELGVVGACLFLGLLAALIVQVFRRLRPIPDPELRAMLAALAAPLLAMVVMFFSSAITAGSPGGPYFWAIGGVLAYWLAASCPWRQTETAAP